MSIRTGAVIAVLASVLGAAPALAGDCNSGPFAGPYVGAAIGYAGGRSSVAPQFESRLSNHDDAFTAGALAGYSWQCGQMVFGVETDINYLGLDAKVIDPTDNSQLTSRVDYFGTVRGRLGVTVHEAMMVYGTAGFAYGGVEHKVFAPNAPGGAFSQSDSDTATGWVIGGGVEFLRHERWLVRAEALYVDLGGSTEHYTCNNNNCNSYAKWDDPFWTARIGVAIKLGHEEHEMEPLK